MRKTSMQAMVAGTVICGLAAAASAQHHDLVLEHPWPGVAGEFNMFEVEGTEWHEMVAFVYGFHSGHFQVPVCNVMLDIMDPRVFAVSMGNMHGSAMTHQYVPEYAQGVTTYIQVISEDCRVSNVIHWTWQ